MGAARLTGVPRYICALALFLASTTVSTFGRDGVGVAARETTLG